MRLPTDEPDPVLARFDNGLNIHIHNVKEQAFGLTRRYRYLSRPRSIKVLLLTIDAGL